MREAEPGLSPGKILEHISPADRGSMLQTLLLSSGESDKRMLWAVSGESLVRIDPRAAPPATQIIPLPTSLGPLRSVRPAEVDGTPRLLIGARGGIIVVHPDGSEPQMYALPQLQSQLGFNSAAIVRGTLWATHAEAGIVGWRLGEGAAPAHHVPVTSPTPDAGPRHLVPLDDGQLLFSRGGMLNVLKACDAVITEVDSERASAAPVVAIIPSASALFIVRSDGVIERRDLASLRIIDHSRPASAASAAAALPWFGSVRLLLATADGPILCVGTEDTLVTHYSSAHRAFKDVTASSDCVAALSGDRQRIVIWQSWDGAKPAAEIHLAGMTRHRVGDLCFS
jgi:hypothetical protein